jgi:hypothetical protein
VADARDNTTAGPITGIIVLSGILLALGALSYYAYVILRAATDMPVWLVIAISVPIAICGFVLIVIAHDGFPRSVGRANRSRTTEPDEPELPPIAAYEHKRADFDPREDLHATVACPICGRENSMYTRICARCETHRESS